MRPLALIAALGLLAAGCGTVIPLQTASTVPRGSYRVGGQLNVAPWCSVTSSLTLCQVAPLGAPGTPVVPMPELRLNGRYGAADRLDLGLSLHVLPAPFRAGAFLDGKLELWSRPHGEGRQVLSLGLGAGVTAGPSFAGTPGISQVELGLPLFYGHPLGPVDLVGSARVLERLAFVDTLSGGPREVLGVTELGLTAGVLTRGNPGVGVQLGYSASVGLLDRGPFSLSVGGWYDF